MGIPPVQMGKYLEPAGVKEIFGIAVLETSLFPSWSTENLGVWKHLGRETSLMKNYFQIRLQVLFISVSAAILSLLS